MHATGTLITGINFQHRKVSHVYWQKPKAKCDNPNCNTRLIINHGNRAHSDELFCPTCKTFTYDPAFAIQRIVKTHARYFDYTQELIASKEALEGKQIALCGHSDCQGEVAISLNNDSPRWTENSICLECGQHYDAKMRQQVHSRQNDELGSTSAHMSDIVHPLLAVRAV
ncbi:hypothetical protein IT409_02685 [Candidatus Falkowbacteria bacterium]|nr:hypothetical protein [Candidatus Falkowbacteria bacterium]